MDRRAFLGSFGAVGISSLSGCLFLLDDSDASGDAPTEDRPQNTQVPPAETETVEPTSAEELTEQPTEASSSSYQVRIRYSGDWSGSISTADSSRSVDGTGTETFDIDGDPYIVSANAQKRDRGADELVVEILQSGEVIARESTTAEFGVAQVTSEDDVNSGGDSDSSSATYEVRIEYSGEWQGSVGQGGSVRSVQGSGTRTITIEGDPNIISANAQKQDDSSNELTIQILENGEVVKETSTTAEYGVAQVSYSNY